MASTITGSITDPDFRRERARIAGKASHSLDRIVDRVVKRADELTDDQRAKLARATLADSLPAPSAEDVRRILGILSRGGSDAA